MFRKFCISALLLAMGSSVASAQVLLERKFPEGTKATVHKDQKVTQTLTLNGMNIDTKSSTFVVSTTSIGKRNGDGSLKVEEKIDSLQTEVTLPGAILQFDSANPDKKADLPQLEPILELFRAISRLPITVEFDAKNKITTVKLPDGEFEKLPQSASERLNPETLKKAIEQMNAFLPDEPVKQGDTWERPIEMNLGAGQTLSFRTKFEYAGTVDQDGETLDKISGKSFDINFAINGNPALSVTKSDLKVVDTDSTYLFDRKRGAVVSLASKIQIAGPLTLVINGAEMVGKVDLMIEDKTTRQK